MLLDLFILNKKTFFTAITAVMLLAAEHLKHRHLKEKNDVNRDSHIVSSPIWQTSFFKEVRCLILASSQRKLRGYIEFL